MDCTEELKSMPIQRLTTTATTNSTIGLSWELEPGEAKCGVHYQ